MVPAVARVPVVLVVFASSLSIIHDSVISALNVWLRLILGREIIGLC